MVPNHETSTIRAKPDPTWLALFQLLWTKGSEESQDGQPPPALDPKPECVQPPPAAKPSSEGVSHNLGQSHPYDVGHILNGRTGGLDAFPMLHF